jgi:hypothetical protein
MVTPKRPEAICLMALLRQSPLGSGSEAVGVLAALAAVAFAADAVHGDGLGFVGLLADGAVGHGTGLEAFDDVGPGFHLFQGRGVSAG